MNNVRKKPLQMRPVVPGASFQGKIAWQTLRTLQMTGFSLLATSVAGKGDPFPRSTFSTHPERVEQCITA